METRGPRTRGLPPNAGSATVIGRGALAEGKPPRTGIVSRLARNREGTLGAIWPSAKGEILLVVSSAYEAEGRIMIHGSTPCRLGRRHPQAVSPNSQPRAHFGRVAEGSCR